VRHNQDAAVAAATVADDARSALLADLLRRAAGVLVGGRCGREGFGKQHRGRGPVDATQ
jgi:hypothetical protein